jgi:hypothetical protein
MLFVNVVLFIESIVNKYMNMQSSWLDAEGKKEFATDFADVRVIGEESGWRIYQMLQFARSPLTFEQSL